jgi:FkbM family methyltransferase
MRPTLAEIITTKNLVTDKNSLHSYCDRFYEQELARYRDQPIQIVEIGIDQGGSLILWAEWFTQAEILGVDLQLRGNCAADCARYPSIKLSIGNAYMFESLQYFPQADIIIDDGPHDINSQIWAVKNLTPKVKPGGLFVIEDVADIAYLDQLKAATPFHLQDCVEFIDLRSVKNRSDDVMFVIRVPGRAASNTTSTELDPMMYPTGPGMDMMAERLSHIKNLINFNDIKNIIDVGAAHGYETLNMARIFKNARVFGFEPTPEHYQHCIKLRDTVENELSRRMTYINAALDINDGLIPFYPLDLEKSQGNNTGMASKYQLIDPTVFPHELNVQKKITVQSLRLDNWCKTNNVIPDMIWMDAQGAELDILKGAENIIESVNVVLTEAAVIPYYQGQTLKHEIDEWLYQRGFTELVSARKLGHQYEMDTIYIRG